MQSSGSRVMRPAKGTPMVRPISCQQAAINGQGVGTGYYADMVVPSQEGQSVEAVICDVFPTVAVTIYFLDAHGALQPTGIPIPAGGFYSFIISDDVYAIRVVAVASGASGVLAMYPQVSIVVETIPAPLSDRETLGIPA